MKLGLLSTSFSPEVGGGYTYLSAIMASMRFLAQRFEVIVLDYSKACADEARLIELRKSECSGAYSSLDETTEASLFSSCINKQLEDADVSVIWILTPLRVVYPSVPFVMTVWDLAHRYFPFFPEVSTEGWVWDERETYYREMLPRAAALFTGTQRGASEIAACYKVDPQRIKVVPFPTPPTEGAVRSETVRPTPFLFYPAQFWPHKNHVRAVRALSILRRDFKIDLDLVFVGSDQGNEGYIKQVCALERLEGHVKFLGFVDRSTLLSLYVEAEALLYLSFFGPDNLPPLEAFALGCPVIASDHPGHREQLSDGALFVDPLDEYAIAQGIIKLRGDPGLREALTRNGRKISDGLTVQAYLRGVSDVIASLNTAEQDARQQ